MELGHFVMKTSSDHPLSGLAERYVCAHECDEFVCAHEIRPRDREWVTVRVFVCVQASNTCKAV